MSEILVLDRNGDQVKVYEREFREIMPVTQRERKQIGYELSSGERLQMVDSVTFILIATGAKFVRIQK